MTAMNAAEVRRRKRRSFWRRVRKHKLHLIMILPVICWYLLFKYGPLYGVTLAFKEFRLLQGIFGSPWVGFDNFKRLFESYNFWNVFRNTVTIAAMKFVFGFPAPIILALMLNELRPQRYKRVVQSLSYLPHFVSWVILTGIFMVEDNTGPQVVLAWPDMIVFTGEKFDPEMNIISVADPAEGAALSVRCRHRPGGRHKFLFLLHDRRHGGDLRPLPPGPGREAGWLWHDDPPAVPGY